MTIVGGQSKIAAQATEVKITSTFRVAVGFHRCTKCEIWTPGPPAPILERFVRRTQGQDSFIWPFDDWWPEGWVRVLGGGDVPIVTLCGPCADEVVYKKVPV